MAWNMLHFSDFSDLQQHATHAQLLAFSAAYLDSAEALCEHLCVTSSKTNYAHGAVAMSLAFHSLELFFKAGIVRLNPKESFAGKPGHDLEALSKRFLRLYPKKEFQFGVPFGHEIPEVVGGTARDELAALRALVKERKREVPEDQRHRYPVDVEGNPWDEVNFSFEPNMFLATLRELQSVYARIQPLFRAG
jgi:hypothetical protein